MIKALPIKGVRIGRRQDLAALSGGDLVLPTAVWFGNPADDLRTLASGSDAGKTRWFMVAFRPSGGIAGVAFYEACPTRLIPNLRVTSVAASPALDGSDFDGVAAAVTNAVAAEFDRGRSEGRKAAGAKKAGPAGYVAIDIGRESTAAADVLRAGGWRCLQPRIGWPTDRLVRFAEVDGGKEKG